LLAEMMKGASYHQPINLVYVFPKELLKNQAKMSDRNKPKPVQL